LLAGPPPEPRLLADEGTKGTESHPSEEKSRLHQKVS
jgi:hypothetical protein